MKAASKEWIQVGKLSVRFLVEASASNGSVTVFECLVPAGARMPEPHSHDGFEETVYGLSGVTSWTIDGQARNLAEGEAICIPRGAIHGFENNGATDGTFLAIASPGVFGPEFFLEVAAVLDAANGGPPDQAAVAEVMRRHGLTPSPPIQDD